MICEVLKPINGPEGKTFQPGEKVDASEWKWAHQLIAQRKLRPVNVSESSNSEVEAAIAFPKRKPGRPKGSIKTQEENSNA